MEFKKDIFAKKFILNELMEKPLIFWDTCALLDILRVTDESRKPSLGSDALEDYEGLAKLIEEGKIVSITSFMVRHELEDNYHKLKDELRKKESTCIGNAKKYISFLENQNKRNKIIESLNSIDVVNRLDSLLVKLCKNTFILKEQKAIYEKFDIGKFSRMRILERVAPASKKAEYKDCYIWLTFVSLVRKINQHKKTVFFTSNLKDYAIDNGREVESRLKKDIEGLPNVELSFYVSKVLNSFRTVISS